MRGGLFGFGITALLILAPLSSIMLINLLIALLLLLPTSTEHRITYYWPGEDNWGNLVADPAIKGDPGPESWSYPWVAVNDLKAYPFGSLLFIEGIGFRWVHDHCPQWNTIDIRVPKRKMEKYERRVWRVW